MTQLAVSGKMKFTDLDRETRELVRECTGEFEVSTPRCHLSRQRNARVAKRQRRCPQRLEEVVRTGQEHASQLNLISGYREVILAVELRYGLYAVVPVRCNHVTGEMRTNSTVLRQVLDAIWEVLEDVPEAVSRGHRGVVHVKPRPELDTERARLRQELDRERARMKQQQGILHEQLDVYTRYFHA
jgi:hypothetical protein